MYPTWICLKSTDWVGTCDIICGIGCRNFGVSFEGKKKNAPYVLRDSLPRRFELLGNPSTSLAFNGGCVYSQISGSRSGWRIVAALRSYMHAPVRQISKRLTFFMSEGSFECTVWVTKSTRKELIWVPSKEVALLILVLVLFVWCGEIGWGVDLNLRKLRPPDDLGYGAIERPRPLNFTMLFWRLIENLRVWFYFERGALRTAGASGYYPIRRVRLRNPSNIPQWRQALSFPLKEFSIPKGFAIKCKIVRAPKRNTRHD